MQFHGLSCLFNIHNILSCTVALMSARYGCEVKSSDQGVNDVSLRCVCLRVYR